MSLLDILPMSFSSRQGYGMLLGLPLAMVSMGAIPVGLALVAYLRRDWALPVLAAATIAAVAVFVADTSGRTATNVLGFAYGALVLALDGLWFLRRRRSFTGDGGARAAALSTR
jgi:Na+/H+-dicarboxylate symporter